MKTLIVYYSMSGNVKKVAEQIAKLTGADLLALHPVKAYPDKGAKKFLWGGKSALMGDKPKLQPYTFNADRYDDIVFGSPVWASSFTPPLRTFIEENRSALDGKRFSAFVCYLGSGDKRALKKLKKELNIEEFEAEMTLTEPDPNVSGETEVRISEFCRKLKKND